MDNPRYVNEINVLAADVREMSILLQIGWWADRPPYLGADGAGRVAGVQGIVGLGPGSVFAGLWLVELAVQPALAEPLQSFRDGPACPEMIKLPRGGFVLGAPEDEFRTIAHTSV